MNRGLAVVFLALAVLPVRAQKVEIPAVKVGDEWHFAEYYAVRSVEANRRWEITEVTPAGIRGRENGEPLALTPDLNVIASPRGANSNYELLRFPLEAGKRWTFANDFTFTAKGAQGHLAGEVTVAGPEQVQVHAGTFETLKLVATGRLSGKAPIGSLYDAETTTTYWYAPSARAIVKSVRHNPYLGTSTVELVWYRLMP